MNPRVLFIVTGDPRISPRPAEAVRVAAGVGVWKRAEISVYLGGEAVRALGEPQGDLVDETDLARHWPILAEGGQPIYAQKNAPALKELGNPVVPFTELSDNELANLCAAQDYVVRF